MTKAFNLLDEPWLPVKMLDGREEKLGLLSVFKQINEIYALAESSPASLIAEYRILLVIVHRALSMVVPCWGEHERRIWFEQDGISSLIVDYLESWRERFWLFHPKYPFMQVAALSSVPEVVERKKSWAQIDLASASGNVPLVFNHSIDSQPTPISCSDAICSLLGFLQFTPGGLVKLIRSSDKAGPLSNSAAVLPLGENLQQTLVLGLHPYSPIEEDQPSWEVEPLTISDLKADPVVATGPNDRYTRQTRAVLFQQDHDGLIRWVYFSAGRGLLEQSNSPDPMVAYRKGSVGAVRVTFNEAHPIWRELLLLLSLSTDSLIYQSINPLTLERAVSILDEIGCDECKILIAGVVSDQAKLLHWQVDMYRFPLNIFMQDEKKIELNRLLSLGEIVFGLIKKHAIQFTTEILPASKQKETYFRSKTLFDNGPIFRMYFFFLERHINEVISQLTIDVSLARERWSQVLHEAASEAWSLHLSSFGLGDRLWVANAKIKSRLTEAIDNALIDVDDMAGVP